ncbi:MAG TPA: LysR family transcriptional regulator [Candidatus Blautia merdigallinarum]|uniref:LysR family transcriptional regulator n=1 Tax=Candidatus Blautia merdigallinarum TaxID=2838495 RepID=A0A9D2SJH0_9FIRM|nr:LysR family transcriptional regulator [Candidatus Blautia merdigallinarum]
MDCAENVLKTLDSGVDILRQSARGAGTIRLGFIRVLGVNWLPALTQEFLKTQQDTEIHFTFHTGITGELVEGLKARHFDLIFSSHPTLDKGLLCVPVAKQNLVLIVPSGHPLAKYEEVDLARTLEYPYIYFSPGSGIRYDVERLFEKIGEKPRIAYETEEDQVIAGLTAQNFGISIVPEMELLDHLAVKKIRIKNSTARRNIYMVSNDQIYIPPAVENFRRFILEGLPESFQTP